MYSSGREVADFCPKLWDATMARTSHALGNADMASLRSMWRTWQQGSFLWMDPASLDVPSREAYVAESAKAHRAMRCCWHRQHLGQNQPYMAHASYVEGLRRATANTADKEYVMNAKSLNLVAVCKRPSIPPARWLCLQLPLCSWLVLLWMIHGLQRELCTNSCLQMSSYVDNFWLQQVKLRLLRSCFAVGSKVDSLCCSN